jgi:hypothetical protein
LAWVFSQFEGSGGTGSLGTVLQTAVLGSGSQCQLQMAADGLLVGATFLGLQDVLEDGMSGKTSPFFPAADGRCKISGADVFAVGFGVAFDGLSMII